MEQKIDYNPIVVLVYVKNEELTEVFRKIFRDVRMQGGKKIIAHVISNSEYWDFFANSREALLDNLDLGLEIFTWKPDQINKILEKMHNTEIKGIITYCDDDNKYQMKKIMESLDNTLKAKILKDNCK
ncbi:DUF5751 family protein [Acidianus manzaensis]|uniref:DUF5751 domain-containing protein n=1 Tax=Acidianus manzaensis TaxID=282676 RepID=A0A1W6JY42_9CREN|nr:DUF5751 family protein [Acidianus manzaensis]ARM75162.1 hypothetical protein B6F84_03340 [Acidianus manzaensis]